MHSIYFARHGETVWNVENKICGMTDSPLTERGRQQARKLGEAVKASGVHIDDKGRILLCVLENHPTQRFQTAGSLRCDVGDMASPVGPTCVVCSLRAGCLMNPGADTAARILKCGTKLSDHQCVRYKVQCEHQNPGEDNLCSIEVYETI